MTKLFLSIAAAAFLLLGGYNYASAEERTDCVGSVTALTENIQTNPTGKVEPISPEETSAIIAGKGKPPVSEPFTFSLASTDKAGMLVIHDKDCILGTAGPAPIGEIQKFLGRVEARL